MELAQVGAEESIELRSGLRAHRRVRVCEGAAPALLLQGHIAVALSLALAERALDEGERPAAHPGTPRGGHLHGN